MIIHDNCTSTVQGRVLRINNSKLIIGMNSGAQLQSRPARPMVNNAFAFKSCCSSLVQRFPSSERITSEKPSCPIHTIMYIYKRRQKISIKIQIHLSNHFEYYIYNHKSRGVACMGVRLCVACRKIGTARSGSRSGCWNGAESSSASPVEK
jgi:hypothetical protein